MQRYKIVTPFIIIIIILALNCNKNDSSGFSFEHEKLLVGDGLSIQEFAYIRYPFKIRKKDSIIYVLDLHGTEHYVHSFNYPTLKHINSFAPKGGGPNEFLSVENIRLNSSKYLFMLDANKEMIRTMHSTHDSIIPDIKLDKDLIRCLDFAIIDDSTYAIPDYTGEYRVHIIDNKGRINKSLFKIPTQKRNNKSVSDIVLAQAWRSFIDYNPNNGILAMATQLGQVIEIYDLKLEKEIKVLYGKYGEPKYASDGVYAVPNGIMGYSDIHVGEENIYTIFWGHTFEDIQKKPHAIKDGGNILQVFTIDGKPLKQYKLDRKITGFHIDELNNKLIALDVNSEEQIVEYNL